MVHHLDKQYYGHTKKTYIYAPKKGELKVISPAGTVTFVNDKITVDSNTVNLEGDINITGSTFSVTGASYFKNNSTIYGATILSGGSQLHGSINLMSDYNFVFQDTTAGVTQSAENPGELFTKTPMSSATGYFTVTIDGRSGIVPMYDISELK